MYYDLAVCVKDMGKYKYDWPTEEEGFEITKYGDGEVISFSYEVDNSNDDRSGIERLCNLAYDLYDLNVPFDFYVDNSTDDLGDRSAFTKCFRPSLRTNEKKYRTYDDDEAVVEIEEDMAGHSTVPSLHELV